MYVSTHSAHPDQWESKLWLYPGVVKDRHFILCICTYVVHYNMLYAIEMCLLISSFVHTQS